jgi:hypothetical protein
MILENKTFTKNLGIILTKDLKKLVDFFGQKNARKIFPVLPF